MHHAWISAVCIVLVALAGIGIYRQVETGQETTDLVQITAGVKPDDLVVTEGGYGLPDGFPVVVKP